MSFQRATIRAFFSHTRISEIVCEGQKPCLLYDGPDAYNGYKAFRCVLAHRAAATIYIGQIPGRVSQTCGDKRCMRLEHLAISRNPPRKVTRHSPLTGRPLKDSASNNAELIRKVLDARPTSGKKYELSDVAKAAGTTVPIVQKILREAALYDLLDDRVKHASESDIWEFLNNVIPTEVTRLVQTKALSGASV